jgi:hypothetical protein
VVTAKEYCLVLNQAELDDMLRRLSELKYKEVFMVMDLLRRKIDESLKAQAPPAVPPSPPARKSNGRSRVVAN